MSALDRLSRARRVLIASTILRAVLVALATAVALLAAAALVDLLVGIPRDIRTVLRGVAIAVAITAGLIALRPAVRAWSASRVALWIEERAPALRYALVTLVDEPDPVHRASLEREVSTVAWEPAMRRALLRGLVIPGVVALVASVLLVVLPASTLARVARPRAGDALVRTGVATGATRSVIELLVATVTPPAYTHGPQQRLEDPSLIAAPVGSALEIEGRGEAARVAIDVDGTARSARARGGDARWSVALRAGARPLTIRLRDRRTGDARVIAVEPRPDGVPRVTIEAPARDSVLRTPTGRIALSAEASDDYGLGSLRFEWIVSAGEGENFTFRSGAASFAGGDARSRRISASLSLDSLALTPGSMVHVRAVALDRNTVSGPGRGASETRVLRVARAGEYDSLAVEAAAPPDADRSALSQRMLILQTEALEKRRPSLDRRTLLREATAIARDQVRLRRRVGEIVFQRLSGEDPGEHSHEDLTPEQLMAHAAAEAGVGPPMGGDETPVLAINQPLLEAYNAMWEAGTSLSLAELREALPPMYRALAAIQRARAAERLYLRGRPAAVVIDIAKVRLVGERPPATGARTGRPAPAGQLALENRFARALTIAARDPAAAADTLMLIRLAVVGDGPEGRPVLAAALADAAARLRVRDAAAAEAALREARRAIAGEPRATTGLPRWGGAW